MKTLRIILYAFAFLMAAPPVAAVAQTSGIGTYTNDPTEVQRYYDFQTQEAARDRADYDANQQAQINALAREIEGTTAQVAGAHFPGMHFGRLLAGSGSRAWQWS